MSFNIGICFHEPSHEEFDLAKKTDLLDLAKHYGLSEINSLMRKQQIENILIRYLVDEEIFEENALSLIVKTESEFKLRELEMKLKYEKREERQLRKEREEKELQLQKGREERELEFQLKMREVELPHQSESKFNSPSFDVTTHIRLIPLFKEKEFDEYFTHLENVAENLKWPKEH